MHLSTELGHECVRPVPGWGHEAGVERALGTTVDEEEELVVPRGQQAGPSPYRGILSFRRLPPTTSARTDNQNQVEIV